MAFNIFKVLEKDDKELIHSAFLQFLLKEDKVFAEELTGHQFSDNCEIKLEKGKKRKRFDLYIEDGDTVIVIENKFKSFPDNEQLKNYDKILKKDYPNHKVIRLLVCFDSTLHNINKNWKALSYKNIIELVKGSKERFTDNEKVIFIQHYINFLSEYYETYESLINNLKEPFLNQTEKMSKFWVRLVYAKLKTRLEDYFQSKEIEVKINFGKESSAIPLIDIIPKHWKIKKYQLLIELQDNNIELYAHTGDRDFITKMVEKVKEHIPDKKEYKIKPLNSKIGKTAYICRLNINELMKNSTTFSEKKIYDGLINFYHTFNEKVIERHKDEF